MAGIYLQNEGTAARRRVHLYLVDVTDGITPETGEAAGQPQISKAGGAWTNTTATLTSLGNGAYYVELTATELNTLGPFAVRYKSANTAEFFTEHQVKAVDLNNTTNLGITALPAAAAEAAGGLYTRGTGAGQINQAANGMADINLVRWLNVAPNALISGRPDVNVGVVQTNAIDSAAIASTATSEIAGAVWDELRASHTTANTFGQGVASVQGNVTGSTASIATGGITSFSIAGDAISASKLAADVGLEIADAVWDELLSGHAVGGSTGAALTTLLAASPPSAAAIADAVWDEANVDHIAAGSTGLNLFGLSGMTATSVADAVWDETLSGHLTAGSTGEALNAASGTPGITVQNIVDGVWDELAADHDTVGTMGANLQVLADAVLIWPTPVGGGVTAETLIARAMTIADMHDNFVSEAEWLRWLNQEQYALRLFLVRAGWAMPYDTTTATITTDGWDLSTDGATAVSLDTTAAGHYVFTPTAADVMALVCIHEVVSGATRRLTYNNAVDFLRQVNGSTNATAHASQYRVRMYGNELHLDFYPTPASGETYLLTFLHAPVPLTATTQAVALPMGWEERIVLGMARRALVKEESDTRPIEALMHEMDSQIEQLCWNRVMSEAPSVRNTDPRLTVDFPAWQTWYWR